MAFLDKLGEVAKNMTEKAGDTLEMNRLNGEIAIEKGNIQCFHRELGEHYWAKFVMGELLDEEAMLICDKVVASQDRMRKLDAQIENIPLEREQILAERAESKRLALEEEDRLQELARKAQEERGETSAVVEVLEAGATERILFCGSCGGSLKAGEGFCIFCGKATSTEG